MTGIPDVDPQSALNLKNIGGNRKDSLFSWDTMRSRVQADWFAYCKINLVVDHQFRPLATPNCFQVITLFL